ncbi:MULTISPECIES: hypothetical protein [Halomonadaceae]|uniref:hypothetical protein n=1 Tax=Halomonas TaxID=2745 RepID=UPI0018A72406|nr:hypothetical protein [Halomonas sp. 328]MBF8223939.1 hypothetical protein [Halomonas sp. 328]
MRDLYRRLGVPPDSDGETLSRAIAACEHRTLRRDAEAVLVEAEHRREYDALHATLGDIGRLRSRLGLTHGAHWRDGLADDFSAPADLAGSHHEALMRRLSQAALAHDRWRRGRALGLGLGLFLLGLLAGAATCHWLLG